MMKTIFALLTIFSVIASAVNYEYYVLAVEWAGTICNLESCNATGIAQNWFNVHGLWPSDYNSEGPENCPGPTWNPNQISSATQSELNIYWSGLYSSNDEFHEHEWTKHGTCWNDNVNGPNRIQDFFSTALSVAQQVGVYATLQAAGISPSDSEIRTEDLLNALSSVYGKVNIQCQSDYVQTIEVCLNLNYQPMDCPDPQNACGDYVKYPSFSSTQEGIIVTEILNSRTQETSETSSITSITSSFTNLQVESISNNFLDRYQLTTPQVKVQNLMFCPNFLITWNQNLKSIEILIVFILFF